MRASYFIGPHGGWTRDIVPSSSNLLLPCFDQTRISELDGGHKAELRPATERDSTGGLDVQADKIQRLAGWWSPRIQRKRKIIASGTSAKPSAALKAAGGHPRNGLATSTTAIACTRSALGRRTGNEQVHGASALAITQASGSL